MQIPCLVNAFTKFLKIKKNILLLKSSIIKLLFINKFKAFYYKFT